jgi:hypothetical protein
VHLFGDRFLGRSGGGGGWFGGHTAAKGIGGRCGCGRCRCDRCGCGHRGWFGRFGHGWGGLRRAGRRGGRAGRRRGRAGRRRGRCQSLHQAFLQYFFQPFGGQATLFELGTKFGDRQFEWVHGTIKGYNGSGGTGAVDPKRCFVGEDEWWIKGAQSISKIVKPLDFSIIHIQFTVHVVRSQCYGTRICMCIPGCIRCHI